jgi:signal transduction histidine kinase
VALAKRLHSCETAHERLLVIGGSCLKHEAALAPLLARRNVVCVDNCFDLFLPAAQLQHHRSEGAYLVTPGWLATWERRMAEWGFDRVTAQEFFAESCTRVVLLDSGVVAESPVQLRAFAEFVNRPCETVPVGLDPIRRGLRELLNREWPGEGAGGVGSAAAAQQAADYAAVFDLMGRVARFENEAQIHRAILDLFEMLFAPRVLAFLPMIDGSPGPLLLSPAAVTLEPNLHQRMTSLAAGHELTPSGTGFLLRVGTEREVLGILLVEGVALPQHRERYVNFALSVLPVLQITISNARNLEQAKRTEQKRLEFERHLQEVQKLESLGVMAGGIAHDFNNLLMTIHGRLELAQDGTPTDSPAAPDIAEALTATRQAAELTSQVLAYTGKVHLAINRRDLNAEIAATRAILTATLAKNVTLTMRLESGLPPVLVDSGQFQQVLLNLVTNAREAIGSRAGTVTLATGVRKYDAAALARNRVIPPPEPGCFVWFEVGDDGCGMDAETVRRMFEPFFTTKFTGRGLGMAAVLGIVKAHRGAILVNSVVGQGSTVRVLLPAAMVDARQTSVIGYDFGG